MEKASALHKSSAQLIVACINTANLSKKTLRKTHLSTTIRKEELKCPY